jgi:predicted phage terminase large subunit-like protein
MNIAEILQARKTGQILEHGDLYSEAWKLRCRHDFGYFRQRIRPGMLWGWWNEVIATELAQFYRDFIAGKRPKMAICTPPQHGKSWTAVDFIGWACGHNPDLKAIFASYSDDLGVRTNNSLQRMFDSNLFKSVFPDLRLGERTEIWRRNASLLEFAGHEGSFRNVTAEGAINGMELNLGVIDDPHKGRNEALSKAARDKVWNWFTDDWMARFAANSAMLVIATRWHIDDLIGRYLERDPDMKIVSYPAIAEKDEFWQDSSKPLRRIGQALFPQLKPKDFLLERKKLMTEASWQSEYQQHPIVIGGGVLPIDKLKVMPHWAPQGSSEIIATIRYWDKAIATNDTAAYTAGVLLHALKDGRFVISHIARGRWSAYERERNIRQYAEDDSKVFPNYEVGLEQEPGSSGRESAENTIRNLAGFMVYVDRVTGSKEVRANPFAAMVQNDQVVLIAGFWVQDFLHECEAWPNSQYKDQVDAAAGAFNRLAQRKKFDYTYSWVG